MAHLCLPFWKSPKNELYTQHLPRQIYGWQFGESPLVCIQNTRATLYLSILYQKLSHISQLVFVLIRAQVLVSLF